MSMMVFLAYEMLPIKVMANGKNYARGIELSNLYVKIESLNLQLL